MNSYVLCGLALAASVTVSFCVKRAPIKRCPSRDGLPPMARSGSYADSEQPSLLTKLTVAAPVIIFAVGFFALDPTGLVARATE